MEIDGIRGLVRRRGYLPHDFWVSDVLMWDFLLDSNVLDGPNCLFRFGILKNRLGLGGPCWNLMNDLNVETFNYWSKSLVFFEVHSGLNVEKKGNKKCG